VDTADSYRAKAAQARRLAEGGYSPKVVQALFEIAQDYEDMAAEAAADRASGQDVATRSAGPEPGR